MSEEQQAKSIFAELIGEISGVIEKVEQVQACKTKEELVDLVDGWELEKASLKAQVKELKEKLSEGKSLIETVVQASGKKDQTHALGVHLDDTGVAFLTASFVKRCRDWLPTPPSTQEGEE